MNILLKELNEKKHNKNENIAYSSIEHKFIVFHYKHLIQQKYCDAWIAWIKKNIIFPETNYIVLFGKQILTPRLQTAFGDEGTSYTFSGTTVYADPWKKPVLLLKKLVEDLTGVKFNFCLLNYYRNGNDYIGAHRDKEVEIDKSAPIASVTFGADRIFKFENDKKKTKNKFIKEFIISNGDVVIFHPPTNEYHKHSLPKQKHIDEPRWNFTFRKLILN
jgi:alpha-ketoglutarate-dependent dioxygenase alkB family protein 2